MRKTGLIIAIWLLFMTYMPLKSQVLSKFTWDKNPPFKAEIGPDAVSISTSAKSKKGGVNNTNGLNPGKPKRDINMVLPGNTFNVDGIDVSIDFHREENFGYFFSRGNSLNFGMDGGELEVSFRIENGEGSFLNVSSGSVYSIPNDDIFRTYRFVYLPESGQAYISVNEAVIWTYSGVAGRPMYWEGSGDMIIGASMDATGRDETIFDNMIIGEVSDMPLPVELLDFSLEEVDMQVVASWTTASETNNNYFKVERSADAVNWEFVGKVFGAGTSNVMHAYSVTDRNPMPGISYYRLSQTDFDGNSEIFAPKSIQIMPREDNLSVFPNPATDHLTVHSNLDLANASLLLFDSQGKVLFYKNSLIEASSKQIDVSGYPEGSYLLVLQSHGLKISRKILVNH